MAIDVRERFDGGSPLANWTIAKDNAAAVCDVVAPTGSAAPAPSRTSVLRLDPAGVSDAITVWYSGGTFLDGQFAAAIYVVGSTPGTTVLARGSGLGTGAASYYGARLAGGASAPVLVKVVGGVESVLAAGPVGPYSSSQYLRVLLGVANNGAGGVDLKMLVLNLAPGVNQGKYLSAAGSWSALPQWCLQVTDSASPLLADGSCGLRREAGATSPTYADDFGVTDAATPAAPTVAVSIDASALPLLSITSTPDHAVGVQCVEYLIDGVVAFTSSDPTTGYRWQPDTTFWTDGTHSVTARAWSAAMTDTSGTASANYTVSGSQAVAVTDADLPRHNAHIRIRHVTAGGAPIPSSTTGATNGSGSYEEFALAHTDFVSSGTNYTAYIHSIDASIALSVYTNFTNLYQDLLDDWLTYADMNGYDREAAFAHVATASAWGPAASNSTRPAEYWWVAYTATGAGQATITDRLAATTSGPAFQLGSAVGDQLLLGFPDPFREINLAISTPGSGWTFALEYCTDVDANGEPTAWAAVPSLSDGTSGGTVSGAITFDPLLKGVGKWISSSPVANPGSSSWNPVRAGGGRLRYYLARIRTTGGTPPSCSQVLGKNYTASNRVTSPGPSGTLQAFDSAADLDGDGYLNNAEYPNRASGKDARFKYESRCIVGGQTTYGQQRCWTLGADPHFRAWCLDRSLRLLSDFPGSSVVFSDNVGGLAPPGNVEGLTDAAYAADMGVLHRSVWKGLPPGGWMFFNSSGNPAAAGVRKYAPSDQFESFGRPLSRKTSDFEADLATAAAASGQSAPAPLLQLDFYPSTPNTANWSYYQNDDRLRTAVLAEYYLIQTDRTVLDYASGIDTASSLANHHWDALHYDIGDPKLASRVSVWAAGNDPAPTLQSELDRLLGPLGYTPGADYAVSGNAGGPFVLTFSGALAGLTAGAVTLDPGDLQPNPRSPLLKKLVAGSATRNKYYSLQFPAEYASFLGGTYTLTVATAGGTVVRTTPPIAYSGSPAGLANSVGAALGALSNVGAANVRATTTSNSGMTTIAFQQALGKTDDVVLTGDFSGITGGPAGVVTNAGAAFTVDLSAGSAGRVPGWGTYALTIATPNGTVTTAAVPVQQAASGTWSYAVYRRTYPDTGTVVLFKPVSKNSQANTGGTIEDSTATVHPLGGTYAPLLTDGTLGPAIDKVSLRNGEGAILIPAGAATKVTASGPASGTVGVGVTVTFAVDGDYTGTATPTSGGLAGTWSPASLSFAPGAASRTAVFTPSAAGTAVFAAMAAGLATVASGPFVASDPATDPGPDPGPTPVDSPGTVDGDPLDGAAIGGTGQLADPPEPPAPTGPTPIDAPGSIDGGEVNGDGPTETPVPGPRTPVDSAGPIDGLDPEPATVPLDLDMAIHLRIDQVTGLAPLGPRHYTGSLPAPDPESTPTPYLVLNELADPHELRTTGTRMIAEHLYQVAVVADDAAEARAIVKAFALAFSPAMSPLIFADGRSINCLCGRGMHGVVGDLVHGQPRRSHVCRLRIWTNEPSR